MRVPRESENSCVHEASDVEIEGNRSHEAMEQEEWRCMCPCVQPGWSRAKGQATEKSLPAREPFDGEERIRKQWVGGEIGGEEGKQRV